MSLEALPIHRLFERQAATFPERPAILCGGDSLTYGELNARADRLARRLREHGVGPGALVSIYTERSAESIVGMLAVMKSGGAYAPFEAPLPGDRLEHQLDHVNAAVILTQQRLRSQLPARAAAVLLLDGADDLHGGGNDRALGAAWTAPRDPAYVMYTSGSTGRPKGVIVGHMALSNYARAICRRLDLDDGEALSFAVASSLATDLGNTCIMPALITGGALHVLPPAVARDRGAFVAYMRRHRIDVLKITPSHLEALLPGPDGALALPRRQLILGGELLSFEMCRRLLACSPRCRIANHYGPTETTVGAVCTQVDRLDDWAAVAASVPIGQPLDNVLVRLLDAASPVPDGQPGELFIGGACLAGGYLHDPAMTAQRFVPSPLAEDGGALLYRTGDLCRRLPDGLLEFCGRADRQVKVRGYRIEPGEIEATLRTHPSVVSAAVRPFDENGRKHLVAYAVLDAGGTRQPPADLRQFIATQLPAFMVPADVVVLPSLPLTPSGKIDYQQLPPLACAGTWSPVPGADEAMPWRALRASWERYLGVAAPAPEQNFFRLGGDSIVAIQISAHLRAQRLHLSPQAILDHPTLAEQAALCTLELAAGPEEIHGDDTASLPLTPIQRWFFAQAFSNPHHWNQAILLALRDAPDPEAMREAIAHVVARHDAFRLRFTREGGEWRQSQGAGMPAVPFACEDLTGLLEGDQEARISLASARIQAGMNLGVPPLLHAAFFLCAPAAPAHLLLVAHHLVIDGISWRILIEDLQQAVAQIKAGEPLRAPACTSSFRRWAEALAAAPAHPEPAPAEAGYWRALAANSGAVEAQLPADHPAGDQLEGNASTLWVSLSVADTQQLLAAAGPGFHLYDLLLAALARTLCWWTEREAVLIDLESHGRDELGGKVELARSVGWFTSLFPLRLESRRGEPSGETLRRSAAAIAAVPRHGIGFGLMFQPGGDGLPPRRFCLNYLGRFQDTQQQGFRWQPSATAGGPARDPGAAIGYHLKLGGRLLGDQLHFDWVFPRPRYAADTIRKVATRYLEELRAFVGGDGAAWGRGEPAPQLVEASTSGLPLAIPPPRRAGQPRRLSPRGGPSPQVLLTGATGYLGIHLLHGLLRQTAASVCCLVRGDGSRHPGERLWEAWRWYFPEMDLARFAARVRVLPGDIRRSRLGMSAADYEAACGEIDLIFHTAADVRLIASAPELAAANVSGTERILKLARTGRRKAIHHISTLSVAGRPPRGSRDPFSERHLDVGQAFTNHYSRSKYDAEKLLHAAIAEGAAVSIYRFGNLAAHSQTGRFQRDIGRNRVYLSLKAYLETGLAPFLPGEEVGFSQVDRVAAGILALAIDGAAMGQTFHVENSKTLSLYDLLRVMQAFGYPIAILSRDEYAARIGQLTERSDYLYGLPSVWGHDEQGGAATVRYDCSATEARLEALGLDFPAPTSGWLRKVIQHCIDVGFLKPPRYWGRVSSSPEILATAGQARLA